MFIYRMAFIYQSERIGKIMNHKDKYMIVTCVTE